MYQISYQSLENLLRQREYDVAKLLRAKEQPVSLMGSHNLMTQNRERQLFFPSHLARCGLKSMQSLVGSLGAQLYRLFCVASAEREMHPPFR
jgi:hypothetical protein